ncbi:peptide-methionine (R)-S-oxide reductase MsrB [Devosia sp.]|uniref:peptide-methionine (R)-S-oxide reductase MsrB n=1 Tax=Devosia sp. TaxID=1871048 RepID=UPI0032630D7E
MDRRNFLLGGCAVIALGAVAYAMRGGVAEVNAAEDNFTVTMTEDQWRAKLGDDAFEVMRKEGTERPFTSELLNEHRKGTFACAGCDLPLYSSDTKFDSGTGWPSFYDHLPNAVGTKVDNSLFGERTEVHCSRCGGHLGHVFNDGPQPTGLRYCMDGIALKFVAA